MNVDGDARSPQIDLPPAWRGALMVAALASIALLLPLSRLIGRVVESRTAARLRERWGVVCAHAYRLYRRRKRPPKTTAGAGARLTLLPPVDPREDVR